MRKEKLYITKRKGANNHVGFKAMFDIQVHVGRFGAPGSPFAATRAVLGEPSNLGTWAGSHDDFSEGSLVRFSPGGCRVADLYIVQLETD